MTRRACAPSSARSATSAAGSLPAAMSPGAAGAPAPGWPLSSARAADDAIASRETIDLERGPSAARTDRAASPPLRGNRRIGPDDGETIERDRRRRRRRRARAAIRRARRGERGGRERGPAETTTDDGRHVARASGARPPLSHDTTPPSCRRQARDALHYIKLHAITLPRGRLERGGIATTTKSPKACS